MRQRNHFMIVFSMLLMLCGQTLAGTLMWCCLAGEPAVAPPAPAGHAMHLDMPHHHDHAMAAAEDGAGRMMPSAAATEGPQIAAGLDCDHACASSCSNAPMLVAAPAPQLPVEFVLASPQAAPALPQADPSLPFRPPTAA